MLLLTMIFAAIISTIIWYFTNSRSELRLGTLCLMYWGASIMWFVDAIFEYAEMGAEYFTPESADMLNDFYLAISVIALGLLIWLVIVLIKDPKGVIKQALLKKRD